MVTLIEAAKYLGIRPDVLYNYRSQGVGPKSTKKGQRVFYDLEDLDRWNQARTCPCCGQRVPMKDIRV